MKPKKNSNKIHRSKIFCYSEVITECTEFFVVDLVLKKKKNMQKLLHSNVVTLCSYKKNRRLHGNEMFSIGAFNNTPPI